MKLKFKLSIMVIAIVAVIVTGIAILLLREATNISIELSTESLTNLLGRESAYWKGREDSHIRALDTLGAIMEDYESIPAATRRDQFDSMLRGALLENDSWVLTYSIWKPNVLDGMDEQYIGRSGSSPTGQYAMTVTRETGRITTRASTDIENTMAHLSGPNARMDRFDDPIARNINGKQTFALIIQVPITHPRTNEVIGAVGCLLDIAVIQPVLEQIMRTDDDISLMVMYSGNGCIIAHFIPDRIGKMLVDVDLEMGENRFKANEAVLSGGTFSGEAYDPTLNTNIIFLMNSFPIGNSDQTWSIMIGVDEAHVLKHVYSITKFTIILALVAILIGAVITYFVLNMLTKPLVSVTETLQDIAEGEGDLTRSITTKSTDEIGDLAKFFNQTLEKIKNLVLSIKGETVVLSGIGTDLASNMNETAAAVNEITANIQSIKERVINQSASVSETHATMEQVVGNINKLDKLVQEQSSNVAQASSAIEQMVANTNSVTNTVLNNANNVKTLKEASEVGRNGLQEVSQDIQEISRESEGLLEINSVMQNIASQTNLLSMNAAIEAAHAGEAGKGFAVVADEIRKLAENSSAQSKTISVVLKKIKGSIEKITHSTGNVLTKFGAIDDSVRIVAEQEENILHAMEEQGIGSKQILDGVGKVNDITRQVRNRSEEMLQNAKEVIRESENLEKATQEIESGMNEMASGANQINVAVHNVNEISGKNRDGIEMLINEVSRFKVE
ncbi:MAG: methyl-accepting chemotaxis protein [Treponema sp.]|nr:methyl-accepting chemotaxis protein [Treponema sp.]MCL2250357.1 methyl-accepting chemotaxis protein [Treponema sp.]